MSGVISEEDLAHIWPEEVLHMEYNGIKLGTKHWVEDRVLTEKIATAVKKETDPHGKNDKEPGAKLDAGKSPVYQGLLDYFPRACLAVAEVSAKGAEKYSWKGWESVPDGINRYSDAIVRHIANESIEGSYDPDGFLHAAQIAWNALAVLELKLRK